MDVTFDDLQRAMMAAYPDNTAMCDAEDAAGLYDAVFAQWKTVVADHGRGTARFGEMARLTDVCNGLRRIVNAERALEPAYA